MLKQLKYVATAAFVMSVTMASTATAQLGFSIDPTQGLPGDVVNGHVNPADINANCNTTAAQVQDAYLASGRQ